MGDLELATSATIPSASQGITVTVYEDVGDDGTGGSTDPNGKAYDNSASQAIDDGSNTYVLSGFDLGSGNSYWIEADISTSDQNVTASLNSVQLTRLARTINASATVAVSSNPEPEAGAYVSGTVTSGGAGAEGAIVRAIRQSDGTQLATATTDTNGDYEMKLEPNQGDVHFTVEWVDGNGDEYRDESYPYVNI